MVPNSLRSTYCCLWHPETKDMCHHTQLQFIFLSWQEILEAMKWNKTQCRSCIFILQETLKRITISDDLKPEVSWAQGEAIPGYQLLQLVRFDKCQLINPHPILPSTKPRVFGMLSKHSTPKLHIPGPELSSVLTTAAPGTKQLINNSQALKSILWNHSYQGILTLFTLHQLFSPQKLQ